MISGSIELLVHKHQKRVFNCNAFTKISNNWHPLFAHSLPGWAETAQLLPLHARHDHIKNTLKPPKEKHSPTEKRNIYF